MSRLVPALAGLLLLAAPAAADVTPRQVWDDWMSSLDEAEVTTGSLVEEGGTLAITDLSIVHGSEETGRYAVQVEALTLTQNGDGTVGVAVSPEYPITLSDTSEDGTARETRLIVRHPDLEMTISGDAGQRTHAFAAPEVRVTVEEVLQDGKPLDLGGDVVFSTAEGRYDAGSGGTGQSVFSAAELDATIHGTEPEDGGRFDLTLDMQGLESENMLQVFGPDAATSVRDMPAGSVRQAWFRNSGSSFALETESEGETVQLNGTAGPGKADVRLSPEGLTYSSEGEAATLAVSGSTIPLPQIAIEMGRIASGITMPLLASEEPQPYGLKLSMHDVVIDQGLWNMFDPAGILPRDPGAIVVDVVGDVTIKEDMGAAQATESLTGELETVKINSVSIDMAEAKAVATGLLTLVGADEAVPVGEIEVILTGANKLLERLATAGILPREQAMGTMMMLGAFATPGGGEDEMISNIRFTEDGGIFVNEQRVR